VIGRRRQAEGTEDAPLGVDRPRLACNVGDKRAGQRRAVVRVDGERSGLAHPVDAMGDKILVARKQLRQIVDEQVLVRVLEARGMRHQMAHEDRPMVPLVGDPQ
jgi:hypothetical protein